MNLDIPVLIESLTLLAAIVFLRNDSSSIWRGFIFYMLIVVAAEIMGSLIAKHHHTNGWVYNIYIIVEALFNSIVFSLFLRRYINAVPLIIVGIVLLSIFYLGELLYHHGFGKFNNLTTTIMSIMFILYGLAYFYFLLKNTEYVVLKSFAPFWWITGTITFYFGSTVSNMFFLMVKFDGRQLFPLRHYIYIGLICILYSCWTYSFICRFRYLKRLHSSSS